MTCRTSTLRRTDARAQASRVHKRWQHAGIVAFIEWRYHDRALPCASASVRITPKACETALRLKDGIEPRLVRPNCCRSRMRVIAQ